MSKELTLKSINFMPDNAQYTNRFKLPSASNPDLEYTIAKNKKTGVWSCSCRGWIIHRHCKHLTSIMPLLPSIEKHKRLE
jgi:hypothetical protein